MGACLGRGEGRKPGGRKCCLRVGDVGDTGLVGGEALADLDGLGAGEDIVVEKNRRNEEYIYA